MGSSEPISRITKRRIVLSAIGLAAVLVSAPFAFKDTPRQVRVLLQREGASPPTDVTVLFAIQREMKFLHGVGRHVTVERDLVFLRGEPAERTVWLEQGTYKVIASDGPNGVVVWELKVEDQDKLVLRFDPARQRPFHL